MPISATGISSGPRAGTAGHSRAQEGTSLLLPMCADEVHLVLGAGKADGAMDAANLLKPMLARGELRCIGTHSASQP